MTFARVVAATDFSDASATALQVAARWAERLDRPLVAVHSFDPAPVGPSAVSPFPVWPTQSAAKALGKRAQAQLNALADGALAGRPHETALVEHPRPALGLARFCNDDDLLVVGTHGRTGVKRILLGSVAEQCIRHAPCAVLAVRGDVDVDVFPHRMSVCTDFSDAALPAAASAGVVARAFGAKATMLTVEQTSDWQARTEAADDEQLAEASQHIDEALESLHEAHLPPPVDVQFVVADHRPQGIVDHAKQTEADLLVMATHGRTGVARMVIGSVTERVSRTAHCPVLVVRSGLPPDDD